MCVVVFSLIKYFSVLCLKVDKGRMVNALALGADEGRGNLR